MSKKSRKLNKKRGLIAKRVIRLQLSRIDKGLLKVEFGKHLTLVSLYSAIREYQRRYILPIGFIFLISFY